MDFLTLLAKLKEKQCPRWSDRQRKLHAYHLVQTYSFYELLGMPDFDDRYKANGRKADEYRPLAERRSAAEYRLAHIITRDVVAMLFGEGKFPSVLYDNESDTEAAAEIIRVANLETILNIAATDAAAGAVALIPEVFVDKDEQGKEVRRLFIDVWSAWECEPLFRRLQPGTLEQLTRTWEVKREDLIADGYDVEAMEREWAIKMAGGKAVAPTEKPPKIDFWYCRRRITETESLWYFPVPKKVYEQKDWDEWVVDRDTKDKDGNDVPGRTVEHGLSLCPALWIAPASKPGDFVGPCIFDGAITNEFLIERVASVGAQAVITAGQPILATSTGNGDATGLQGDASAEGTDGYPETSGGGTSSGRIGPEDVIEVAEKGGAWLVQLDAGALTPMDSIILRLRALALENCGGSRITEESLTGAKSGYAMELLNQALTYTAGAMRPAWSMAILALLRLIAVMRKKFGEIEGLTKELNPQAALKSMSWGPWYEPSGEDLTATVQATTSAREAGFISGDTGVASVAPLFDVVNIEEEKSKIKTEQTAQADQEHQRALELKTATPKPAA